MAKLHIKKGDIVTVISGSSKYRKLADGTEVIITGTVSDASAWSDQFKNMNVTITDSTGSLYVYRLSTQVKNGDVIKVTGKMATYNDARQIAQGATAVIVTAA